MIITEYRVDGAADNCSSIAIVADLHEFEPMKTEFRDY